MNYRIDLSPEAQLEIKRLPGYIRAQALQSLHSLRDNHPHPRAKELRDKSSIYRIWLAKKWRIVYSVDEESDQILILRVRLKEHIDYESL